MTTGLPDEVRGSVTTRAGQGNRLVIFSGDAASASLLPDRSALPSISFSSSVLALFVRPFFLCLGRRATLHYYRMQWVRL